MPAVRDRPRPPTSLRFATCRPRLAPRQQGDHLRRERAALEAERVVGVAAGPDALLVALDGERAGLEQAVADLEAAAAEAAGLGLDHQLVAKLVRDEEARPRVDHREADRAVAAQDLGLGQAGAGEEAVRAGVEPGEVARVEDDPDRVAVAPLHRDDAGAGTGIAGSLSAAGEEAL